MEKIKNKKIKEICNDIDLIIAGEDKKVDYKYTFLHLNNALVKGINYDEIVLICETIVKIAKTKNKIIRYLETNYWSYISKIPFQIILVQELDISENEELLSNIVYDNTNKRILSRLIGLAVEIVGLKDDNSKGSDLRRAGSLRIIGELNNYFHIPIAKSLFVASIKSKNKNEQYAALEGLENYYEVSDDEIEDDLVKILNDIKNQTDDRTVAFMCLQIQINAGIMDEMSAICDIDDWKDKNEDYD